MVPAISTDEEESGVKVMARLVFVFGCLAGALLLSKVWPLGFIMLNGGCFGYAANRLADVVLE